MPPRPRAWTLPALLLLVGALLRLYFLRHHPLFVGDADLYADLAQNMVRHHIFGFTEAARIRPTLIRLPGFPLFLAAIFIPFGMGNFIAVLWLQLLLSLIDCVLLALLAARLFGKPAGLCALALACLCPFTADYAAAALTETTSLFCVTLAFFSLERWSTLRHISTRKASLYLIPLTFALVFAIFLRPDQSLLAAAVVPAILWISLRSPLAVSPSRHSPLTTRHSLLQRLAPTAAVTLGILAPILLWTARNYHVFHVIQPLAPRYANDPGEPIASGFNRWYRTWAIDFKSTVDIYWNYDGSLIQLKDLPARAFDTPAQRAQTAALFADYNDLSSANASLDQRFAALAAARVAAHPIRFYLLLPAAKLADMWLRPRTELMKMPLDWWNFRAHRTKSIAAIAYAALNLAYLTLAAIGLYRWRRRQPDGSRWTGHAPIALSMLTFILLRNILLWTLDNSEPRYTLECFPLIILLATFALIPAPHNRRPEAENS